jgi:hypothetical protein
MTDCGAGEVDVADRSTPRPWHAYVGGNFVKVGCEGYDEYVEKEHYLAGPFCVLSMECNAKADYSYDMLKAVDNVEVLLTAVNAYPALLDALSKIAAMGDRESAKTAQSALGVLSSQAFELRKDLDASRNRIQRETPSLAA